MKIRYLVGLCLILVGGLGGTAEGVAGDLQSALSDLKSANPETRRLAVVTLYQLKDPRAVKPLIATLKDGNSDVATTAVAALTEMPDDRTVKLLIHALKDRDSRVRLLAARALGRIKKEQAIDPLMLVLKDEDSAVRREAIDALVWFDDYRVINLIIGMLSDYSVGVRLHAAEALGQLRDPRIRPLVSALKDDDISVRLGAEQSLLQIVDRTNEIKDSYELDRAASVGGDADLMMTKLESMSEAELVKAGEYLIFGSAGLAGRGIGKGQCPLCHTFKPTDIGDRAPNLSGIIKRAATRIKEPGYLHPDTIQTEAFQGSGRATTAMEYLAESNVCTSCYVVPGFGVKGTNDRESPYATINRPPISLTISEMILVNRWLYVYDGQQPPPIRVMQAAYEKFILPAERVYLPLTNQARQDKNLTIGPDDSAVQIITKLGCAACHKIPEVSFARMGAIGPLLVSGTSAAQRIASPEYQAVVKAGKAHAKTPREYIMESIMVPSAFIVQGFEPMSPGGKSLMPDFISKLDSASLDKLTDFLMTLDISKAMESKLDRHPLEKDGSLYSRSH
ncbi:MAG: HEAT repeat domain-containing protein [Nitrospirae bacterium]|nr:HEAT repeat domain-containing protein [Nitrospirota bacterium]